MHRHITFYSRKLIWKCGHQFVALRKERNVGTKLLSRVLSCAINIPKGNDLNEGCSKPLPEFSPWRLPPSAPGWDVNVALPPSTVHPPKMLVVMISTHICGQREEGPNCHLTGQRCLVGHHHVSCEHTIKGGGVKVKGGREELGCSFRRTIPPTHTYRWTGTAVAPVCHSCSRTELLRLVPSAWWMLELNLQSPQVQIPLKQSTWQKCLKSLSW